VHLAALGPDGTVVACATFFPESYQGRAAWRLRGMATDPAVRGQGYAAAVLTEALRVLAERGVDTLWCNARTGALWFYRGFGFRTVGEEFQSVGVPHYVAVRSLPAPSNGAPNGTST
jgi:predicted GNAT family N-acyltransferase